MQESRQKTGVFTGGFLINPMNDERVPVWIADYVLMGYGTGAVMGVPAHDPRDFEFARLFGLPVRMVISPDPASSKDSELLAAYLGEGTMVNSGPYDGMPSHQAIERICSDLSEKSLGGPKVNYRMRDWLISRQRYWGTPIPIVHCDLCGIQPVPETDLPVLLPPMINFSPDGSGRSPLARLPEFVQTVCPECGGKAQRETDTMGGFACSSWYFLRFTSPQESDRPFDPDAVRYWMPVDLYVGGAEHAVLHLLYSRFWVKVMADEGLLTFREPFAKLINQGQLLGADHTRMAKSRGNVITPDSIVESYGADSLRIYEMFMAPFDQDIAWSTDGINGAWRFLNRIWNLFGETFSQTADIDGLDPELERMIHRTIRRVEQRIQSFRFNTMISTLMEFVNDLIDRQRAASWQSATFHQALETLLLLLAPSAPFITDELWQLTGHSGSIHQADWPTWDPELARDQVSQLPVQVDGKLRDVLDIPTDSVQMEVNDLVMTSPRLQPHLAGRGVERIVYIPGKVINIVTRPNT